MQTTCIVRILLHLEADMDIALPHGLVPVVVTNVDAHERRPWGPTPVQGPPSGQL
jgi:hypothetical protein